jgi:exopolyphosphatase / guanosine-5'-triphosphate,3'-diphosphate pyrophosphatase
MVAEPFSAERRTLLNAKGNNGDTQRRGTSKRRSHAQGQGRAAHMPRRRRNRRAHAYTGPTYGALDLGTNNCRLLVARPTHRGFKVIDAFSRIVRLGEGLGRTGVLSDGAMSRTIEALKICTEKLVRRNVKRSRLIATEACRIAHNGPEFIERVYRETGLRIEVIDQETEAHLAVAGSASLIEPDSKRAMIFDIGGGSSELMWLSRTPDGCDIEHWVSLPVGVVTLADQFDGRDVPPEKFRAMKAVLTPHLHDFATKIGINESLAAHGGHMLGTSGTVTTLAGISMGLQKYDRNKVDGCWLTDKGIRQVTDHLMAMNYQDRVASPCIGIERADLVMAGCAILSSIIEKWPCSRVRVADRGLREGILTSLMESDGHECASPQPGNAHYADLGAHQQRKWSDETRRKPE